MIGDKLVIKDYHKKAAEQIYNIIKDEILSCKSKYAITIAGESGSGKSEIAFLLKEKLKKDGIESIIINQDDYFVYPPKTNSERRRKDISWVGMGEVQLGLLEKHLEEFISGKQTIEKPLVIFDEDKIKSEKIDCSGLKVMIIEGTYTTILKGPNMKIFLSSTYMDTKQARKQRAREKQDEYLEKILEIEHKIISSHRKLAELIVEKDYSVIEQT